LARGLLSQEEHLPSRQSLVTEVSVAARCIRYGKQARRKPPHWPREEHSNEEAALTVGEQSTTDENSCSQYQRYIDDCICMEKRQHKSVPFGSDLPRSSLCNLSYWRFLSCQYHSMALTHSYIRIYLRGGPLPHDLGRLQRDR
jgi:hypothetical protein